MFEEPQWFSWHDGDCGNGSYISAFIKSSFCEIYICEIYHSKTFSSITASNPYGEDITVSKIECVGHVQKRMGTRLRKLKQMSSKLSDGKSIGGKGKLTDRMIDLITTYYGNAIRQNKTCLSDMRKAVWAVYFHIRSSDEEPLHKFCPVGPNSWCKYQNQVVEGSVETFRHSNKLPLAVMDAIKPVFNDLSQPKLLQKCLGGKTQNNNESINSGFLKLWGAPPWWAR
ncbi:uncharacterized protein TNCV_1992371 [Trichonephila clavipes]|nr:uncharacterized protein TNCV_1992371 [Trichonephila clavipes]